MAASSLGLRLDELADLTLTGTPNFDNRWERQEALNMQQQQRQLQQQLLEERQALYFSQQTSDYYQGRDRSAMMATGLTESPSSLAASSNFGGQRPSISSTLRLQMNNLGFGELDQGQSTRTGLAQLNLNENIGGDAAALGAKPMDFSHLYIPPQQHSNAFETSFHQSVAADQQELATELSNSMLKSTAPDLSLRFQSCHNTSPQQPATLLAHSSQQPESHPYKAHRNNLTQLQDLLLITNQPSPFGRFRYKSEQRERPLESEKGFPEIQVNPKYLSIVPAGTKCSVRLVTKTVDENGNPYAHFHELAGNTEVALQGDAQTAQFDNLTVLMSKQGVSAANRGARRNKEDQRAVRLLFEVAFVSQGTAFYGTATSQPIFNAKLVINKLSHAYGPATGQNEVVLLCSKIRKGATTVRLSDDGLQSEGSSQCGREEAWAKSDVAQWQFMENGEKGVCMLPARYLSFHHQYAIVVEMPPYHKPQTMETARIHIQIVDFEDGTESPPVTYTYVPSEDIRQACVQESKKRRLDEGMREFWQQFQGHSGESFSDASGV